MCRKNKKFCHKEGVVCKEYLPTVGVCVVGVCVGARVGATVGCNAVTIRMPIKFRGRDREDKKDRRMGLFPRICDNHS